MLDTRYWVTSYNKNKYPFALDVKIDSFTKLNSSESILPVAEGIFTYWSAFLNSKQLTREAPPNILSLAIHPGADIDGITAGRYNPKNKQMHLFMDGVRGIRMYRRRGLLRRAIEFTPPIGALTTMVAVHELNHLVQDLTGEDISSMPDHKKSAKEYANHPLELQSWYAGVQTMNSVFDAINIAGYLPNILAGKVYKLPAIQPDPILERSFLELQRATLKIEKVEFF